MAACPIRTKLVAAAVVGYPLDPYIRLAIARHPSPVSGIVKISPSMLRCAALAFAVSLASSAPATAHNRAVAYAPALSGIVVDGDLSDWPQLTEWLPITLVESGVGLEGEDDGIGQARPISGKRSGPSRSGSSATLRRQRHSSNLSG